MAELNRTAKRVLERYEVHACTDVTGFGLAGHSMEMAKASKVSMDLFSGYIPVMEGAAAYAPVSYTHLDVYKRQGFIRLPSATAHWRLRFCLL